MTSNAVPTTSSETAAPHNAPVVTVQAAGQVVRRLGEWTTEARFEILAVRSVVLLDFLLPRIDAERIDLRLDIDHSLVTLLVPDGARIVQDELRWIGRGRLRDWSGVGAPDGLAVHLSGEARWGGVRVRRGGVALLSLMRHGRTAAVRRSYRDGRPGGTPR